MNELEEALLSRATQSAECCGDLTPEVLREISSREGIDFATALLHQRLTRAPQHARFIARIDQLQAAARKPGYRVKATVAIVPAAFYQEKPHSGADGALVREVAADVGLECETIPVKSTGTLAQNSHIIVDWLAEHQAERVILVSLCKGGADVKFAMATPGAASWFGKVPFWINICGTLNGSPIAQWLLSNKLRFMATWLLFKCQGRKLEFLQELGPGVAGALAAPLRLPEAMSLINLVGFPLRRHLSNTFMRRCHRAIAPLGPNDGGLVLAEACAVPGLVYPIWGADHYLRPAERSRRLFAAVLEYVKEKLEPRVSDSEMSGREKVVLGVR